MESVIVNGLASRLVSPMVWIAKDSHLYGISRLYKIKQSIDILTGFTWRVRVHRQASGG